MTFKWKTTAEIFAPLPEVPTVIEGLDIVYGRPTVFASQGSGGKTWAAQAMTLALCAGRPVWGRFQPARRMSVGHVDCDQGDYATCKRYQKGMRGEGLTPEDIGDRLLMSSMSGLSLADPKAADRLCRIIDAASLDLVWFDAYRRLIPGVDENDSLASVGLEACTKASEKMGVPIIMLVHSGHNTKHPMRGNSSLFDSAGAVYQFTSPRPSAPKKVEHVRPSAAYDGNLGETFNLTITTAADGGVRVRASEPKAGGGENEGAEPSASVLEQVRAILTANPTAPKRFVVANVMGARNTVIAEVYDRVREELSGVAGIGPGNAKK